MNLSQEEDSRKVKKKNSHCLPQVEADVTGKDVKETEEEHVRQNGIPVTESAMEYSQRPAKEEVNELMLKTEEIFLDETQEREQEEEEEEHGLMSADELHRKCEEFIKKMREEIKVEFHQPIRIKKSHV